MRLIAAERVTELAVDDFLQDQMAPRMLVEIGCLVHGLKIGHVSVQIAGDDNVSSVGSFDEPTASARRRLDAGDGTSDRV
jgi:hypothetical protein